MIKFKHLDSAQEICGYPCLYIEELTKQQCEAYLSKIQSISGKYFADCVFINSNIEKSWVIDGILNNDNKRVLYHINNYTTLCNNIEHDIQAIRSRILQLGC